LVTFFARAKKVTKETLRQPRAVATRRFPALLGESGDGAELAALRHRRLFAPDSPAMLGSLKADWKVKIKGNSMHAWHGSTGCRCGI
ncbi:hypothetical protein, partial [Stenotrophomonas maltophilia]